MITVQFSIFRGPPVACSKSLGDASFRTEFTDTNCQQKSVVVLHGNTRKKIPRQFNENS